MGALGGRRWVSARQPKDDSKSTQPDDHRPASTRHTRYTRVRAAARPFPGTGVWLTLIYPVAVTWMRQRDHNIFANAASLLVCGVLAGVVVADCTACAYTGRVAVPVFSNAELG